jgi:hypothetical protein
MLLVFVSLLLAAIVLSHVRVFLLCSIAQLHLALMPCIGLYLLLLLNARAEHLPFFVKKRLLHYLIIDKLYTTTSFDDKILSIYPIAKSSSVIYKNLYSHHFKLAASKVD